MAVFASLFLFNCASYAQNISISQIRKELNELKIRINKLEQELSRKDREIEKLKAKVESSTKSLASEEAK